MSEEKAIEKLGNKIDGIKSDVGKLRTSFAVQGTKLDRVILDLDEVKTIVEGNGLARKVNDLENWRSSIGKWSKWILGIVATLIASSIAILAFG